MDPVRQDGHANVLKCINNYCNYIGYHQVDYQDVMNIMQWSVLENCWNDQATHADYKRSASKMTE